MSDKSETSLAGKPEGETKFQAPSSTLTRTTKSLAQLELGVAHYPDHIRADVLWLHGFLIQRCQSGVRALHAVMEKAVPGFKRSPEWVYNVIAGQLFTTETNKWKRGGPAEAEFAELMAAMRRYDQQLATAGKLPFVLTPTYRCIVSFITACRAIGAVCKFGAITGATGTQKSSCLKYYAMLNNHGTVTHVECPRSGRLSELQRKILRKFNGGKSKLSYQAGRQEAIADNMNETRTLILDNVQRLYSSKRGTEQPAFDWLLELQDETGCTIILSFTNDFEDTLNSSEARGYFEQFVGRFGGMRNILRLPEYTPAADLRAIARSFDLDPGKGAMEYLERWSREFGRVRIVFDRLQKAQQFAKAAGRERITLADLNDADQYAPPAFASDDEGGEA